MVGDRGDSGGRNMNASQCGFFLSHGFILCVKYKHLTCGRIRFVVKCCACTKRLDGIIARKDNLLMAKCAHCGKKTSFGHNRFFSLRATNRKFLPNLQRVTVYEKGTK